jgi:pimeloyl-ACP methyl ester carboxylesterase
MLPPDVRGGSVREIDLPLPDGGSLQAIDSEVGSDLLIYHHGTPAAGPLSHQLLEAAAAHDLRLVELVRPGYGRSTRRPDRNVAFVAALSEALADHLEATRFVTMGWSGGGPHALAAAALLPTRCAGAMLLAGVAPHDAADLDFLEGMGADNIAEFGAALAGPDELESFLRAATEGLRTITAADVVASLSSLLPEVDRAFLDGPAGEELAAQLRFSVAHGIWGWYDDDVAFTRPWGFDITAVRRPIAVWQGTEDLMVPFAHGQCLASRIPGARSHLIDGHGHLSLAADFMTAGFGELRSWL